MINLKYLVDRVRSRVDKINMKSRVGRILPLVRINQKQIRSKSQVNRINHKNRRISRKIRAETIKCRVVDIHHRSRVDMILLKNQKLRIERIHQSRIHQAYRASKINLADRKSILLGNNFPLILKSRVLKSLKVRLGVSLKRISKVLMVRVKGLTSHQKEEQINRNKKT